MNPIGPSEDRPILEANDPSIFNCSLKYLIKSYAFVGIKVTGYLIYVHCSSLTKYEVYLREILENT